jgi:hypothetical protein
MCWAMPTPHHEEHSRAPHAQEAAIPCAPRRGPGRSGRGRRHWWPVLAAPTWSAGLELLCVAGVVALIAPSLVPTSAPWADQVSPAGCWLPCAGPGAAVLGRAGRAPAAGRGDAPSAGPQRRLGHRRAVMREESGQCAARGRLRDLCRRVSQPGSRYRAAPTCAPRRRPTGLMSAAVPIARLRMAV